MIYIQLSSGHKVFVRIEVLELLVLMILNTEDNVERNGQKIEQVSYAFTSNHNHCWDIKVINCFVIL